MFIKFEEHITYGYPTCQKKYCNYFLANPIVLFRVESSSRFGKLLARTWTNKETGAHWLNRATCLPPFGLLSLSWHCPPLGPVCFQSAGVCSSVTWPETLWISIQALPFFQASRINRQSFRAPLHPDEMIRGLIESIPTRKYVLNLIAPPISHRIECFSPSIRSFFFVRARRSIDRVSPDARLDVRQWRCFSRVFSPGVRRRVIFFFFFFFSGKVWERLSFFLGLDCFSRQIHIEASSRA